MKEDRLAFKNRMRSLRTYREQNPGKGYWEWKKAIQDYKGIDIDNDPTYDYYGFYKENPETAKGILNDSKDAHFTDTYKTSVHPTFSNESKYSGYVNKYNPKGVIGGYWGEDNSYNFSDSQIKNNWDIHNTLRYLEDAENYGVTAKYRGMYPKDTDNVIYGGVLPQVEVRAQAFNDGGETTDPRIRRASPPRMTLLEIKERNRIDSIKYEKSMQDVNLIMDAMNRAVDTKPYKRLSTGIKSIQDNNSEQAKEKWNDYKKGIEAVATAATWFSGLSGLSRYGITKGFLPANKIVNGIVMSDTGLMIANGAGALGGAYQTISSDSPAEGLWNGTQTALNAAGVVGGSNWFRNSKLFRKHGARIDNVLDKLGMTGLTTDGLEMSYDIVDSVLGYDVGGEVLPTRGTTVTNAYGDKTHYIATSMDDDGTLNLSLPDIEITPRNNLNLAGSVSKAMDNVARSGVNAATYVTPLGDVEAVYDIGKNVSAGNYGQAALGAGLILLPNFIEKPIRRGIRKLRKWSNADLRASRLTDRINRMLQDIEKTIYKIGDDKYRFELEMQDSEEYAEALSEILSEYKNPYVSPIKKELEELSIDYNLALLLNRPKSRFLDDSDVPRLYRDLYRLLYDEDPQYIDFSEQLGLPFWELSTVDRWIDKQRTTIRGVYSDVENAGLDILEPMLTQTKYYNPGGDRLGTYGGLYTSNSMDIADRFSRSLNDKNGTAAYAILKAPDIDRSVSIRDLLAQLRRRIYPYDVMSNHGIIDIEELRKHGYIGVQSKYTTGQGAKLPAYETAYIADKPNTILKVLDILEYNTSNVTKNIAGRWGKGAGGAELTDELYSPRIIGKSLGDFIHDAKTFLYMNKERIDLNKKILKPEVEEKVENRYYIKSMGYDPDLRISVYKDLIEKNKDRKELILKKARELEYKKNRINNITGLSGLYGGILGTGALIYSLHNSNMEQLDKDLSKYGVIDALHNNNINVSIDELPPRLKQKFLIDAGNSKTSRDRDYYIDALKQYGVVGYNTGGEVEPLYPQFVNGQRVNRWTGQPIATGQATPVFDLRDAADFTPAGDVLAVKDTYEAVLNNDWVGAGLAAVGVLPFVPSVTKKLRREIPTVNKNYVSDAIDALDRQRYNRSSAEAAMNNETYEIVQRLMDDPSYMRRANEVKYRYGDDYLSTYADLINAYNYSPELLPKAKVTEEAMNKLPKSMSSIINASKQFKSMRAYTKWFNQIPLLTAGALGINRYYNQQQEQ